ncbi:MAG: DUF808 domain-containing protein [Acidobacteriota bacterium]
MPGGSLLLLLDDIASTLDDISIMTKVAAKKTAGVVGDDLALNAQQLMSVRTDRELTVVWSVAKGSMLNKAILVPGALATSTFFPWLVTPLLMIGGAFLCFEGVEKLFHKLLHRKENPDENETIAHAGSATDSGPNNEQEKIRGAIRTDFILSAEIIVIALGAVAGKPFLTQLGVLTVVAVFMTVGVYGLVSAIVKLDDVGLHLSQCQAGLLQSVGRGIVGLAPHLMKVLSIAGTAAMFLVGGGILVHGLPMVHHWVEELEHLVAVIPSVGRTLAWLVTPLGNGVFGVLAGAVILMLVLVGKQIAVRFGRHLTP